MNLRVSAVQFASLPHKCRSTNAVMFSCAVVAVSATGLGFAEPNNSVLPTLFPPWKPVWKLDRSTIAMPCNYSGV